MYVYTKNNPVKFTDLDGRWVWTAAAAVIGAAAGAYAGYRFAKKRGWRGWKRCLAIAGGAVVGAAIGAVAGHYARAAVRIITTRGISIGSRRIALHPPHVPKKLARKPHAGRWHWQVWRKTGTKWSKPKRYRLFRPWKRLR